MKGQAQTLIDVVVGLSIRVHDGGYEITGQPLAFVALGGQEIELTTLLADQHIGTGLI